eukprot:UN00126
MQSHDPQILNAINEVFDGDPYPPSPNRTQILNVENVNIDGDPHPPSPSPTQVFDETTEVFDPRPPSPNPTQILNKNNVNIDGDSFTPSPNPTIFDETKDQLTLRKIALRKFALRHPQECTQVFNEISGCTQPQQDIYGLNDIFIAELYGDNSCTSPTPIITSNTKNEYFSTTTQSSPKMTAPSNPKT